MLKTDSSVLVQSKLYEMRVVMCSCIIVLLTKK